MKRINYFKHVLSPILLGGSIYTLWRKPSLLLFNWYEWLGLSNLVGKLRHQMAFAQSYLPDWVLFSLPDACWAYALTAFMILIWQETKVGWYKPIWASSGLLLGVGSELLQWIGFIQGTFDLTDLIGCALAPLISWLLINGTSSLFQCQKGVS